MPYGVVWETNHGEVHESCHLSEALGLCVFLKAEGREVNTISEDASFGEDADTPDSIDLHLHIRITVGIPQVGQMWPPCRILGVALDNHSILIQGISQGQGRLRFLPRVEIVRLLSAEPFREWSPHICVVVNTLKLSSADS